MDHQRLRLVPTTAARKESRAHERRPLRVPGQLVWKDSRGTTRLARILTRDVSAYGVSVDCFDAGCIPLYRLVYLQIDRAARESNQDLPIPIVDSVIVSPDHGRVEMTILVIEGNDTKRALVRGRGRYHLVDGGTWPGSAPVIHVGDNFLGCATNLDKDRQK